MDVVGATAGGGGASLIFQLMLYFSTAWCGIWFILTLALLIFKGTKLHFPPAALPMEIVSSFLVLIVNFAALSLGVRGNLMEESNTTFLAIGLLIIAAVGAVYYMWLQTYVMMLDLVFSAILLGFNGLAALAGLYGVQGVLRARRGPRQKFALPPQALPTFARGEIKREKED